MVVLLPFDTINRILTKLASAQPASDYLPGTEGPVASNAPSLPALASNIVATLKRAKRDPTLISHGKYVGALQRDEFGALATWCRRVDLPDDATAVENAVRAAPE